MVSIRCNGSHAGHYRADKRNPSKLRQSFRESALAAAAPGSAPGCLETGRSKTVSMTASFAGTLAEAADAQIRSRMLIDYFFIHRKQPESRNISLALPDFALSLLISPCLFVCSLISLFVLSARRSCFDAVTG
jgi:hypothetical protein